MKASPTKLGKIGLQFYVRSIVVNMIVNYGASTYNSILVGMGLLQNSPVNPCDYIDQHFLHS